MLVSTQRYIDLHEFSVLKTIQRFKKSKSKEVRIRSNLQPSKANTNFASYIASRCGYYWLHLCSMYFGKFQSSLQICSLINIWSVPWAVSTWYLELFSEKFYVCDIFNILRSPLWHWLYIHRFIKRFLRVFLKKIQTCHTCPDLSSFLKSLCKSS